MMAARSMPCASSSFTQRAPSSTGSLGGSSQPSPAAISSAGLPACAASDSKKRREKKCTCASETAHSPHGVCIGFVEVREAGSQRELRQPGHVVHAELFHHGLPVAAHGLQAQIEHHRDV